MLNNAATLNDTRTHVLIHKVDHNTIFSRIVAFLLTESDSASMDRNFKTMNSHCIAITTELSYDPKRNHNLTIVLPGINHLMYYLNCKFTWDTKADMNEILNDYYEKFYGPAAAEMKEFFEFAEEVWMRQGPRQITAHNGFLKPQDITKYFEILERAKAKAGDTVYGKRIAFIVNEMAPLKKLFTDLKRTGPYMRIPKATELPEINGDLSKDFWTKSHPGEILRMSNNVTGVTPDLNGTSVTFRWLPDSSLAIGISCYENRMKEIKASTNETLRDSQTIWEDDTVEVRIETPEGYVAFVAVNPNGSIFDTCISPDVTEVPSAWNVEKAAVKKYDDRWTVELKIKGLGKEPTKSYPWGINVFRQRMAGVKPEGFALSPTGTDSFNEPTKMGNLFAY